jgi:hypothetical protein
MLNLRITKLTPSSSYFCLLGLDILCTMFSDAVGLFDSLIVADYVSHQYNRTQITEFCLLGRNPI